MTFHLYPTRVAACSAIAAFTVAVTLSTAAASDDTTFPVTQHKGKQMPNDRLHPVHAAPMAPAEARAVIEFWREAGPALWFAKDTNFDERFRTRFIELHESAARGGLAQWSDTPEGALALVILLDQFPRNAFRGTARMYASDVLARQTADKAIGSGYDLRIDISLALFLYLPFGHSEAMADQERSVALAERLGEPSLSHARHHRAIIQRFGRFPHRNPVLGREMKPDEQRFLDEGGFAG
jgi:uncharacterized protein (DUF924 family)